MNIKKLYLKPNSLILVTGGAGFIGSNLCEALIANGNKVRCLDNLATGKFRNIQKLLEHPNFDFKLGDIRDLNNCRNSCEGVDYVLHQAALGSVPRSVNDPITSSDVNVTGFLNMLVAARDAKVKRFVYAASSSTYGDSKNMPKVEAVIGKPLSPYAVTKLVNELYADVFGKTYAMETIGLRYFNVFGRHQDPNGAYAAVIPKFVMQLIRRESPKINGDGSFSRDFTFIDNVIEANIRALTTERPESINTVYNIAYGQQTTLNELIHLLKEYLTLHDPLINEVKIEYGPEREGDVAHSLASIEKARRLLGYDPKVDFKSGLKEAVQWYWENFNQEQ